MSDSPIVISALKVCPKCGTEIPSDVPELGCPRCLLESALNQHTTTSESLVGIVGELGDYELLEVVGRGGQGVVYRAHQKSLNRTVALKMISVGSWATGAHLKRFRREAEAAASLEHPGIVPIYEVGERDGSCYFSMRFVEGGQLDQVIKREPMSVRQAAELISKVARTVHYAHEHGILHRDIKPGNILLDAKGEPLLTDFGLARLVEAESTVTRTKEVMGTPSYMAPEQAVGNNAAVSSATDVYGLGAVLYQLLTGHPPFAGGTTYETIKLLLDTEPRPPRSLNPKIDRELSTICLKCLEKDPKRRYTSALALAEDLEHWIKHEPIRAKPSGFFTHSRKWVRRNPSTTILAALLVALAAALSLIVWSRQSGDRTTSLGEKKSIAVMPFENEKRDPSTDYLCDGIPESIINSLSQLSQLNVVARSTVFQYKGKDFDPRKVGHDLGVRAVLTGRLIQQGKNLTIRTELLNVSDGTELWGQQYNRKLVDVFGLQEEVAKEIAGKLSVKLTGDERQQLAKRPTENLKAFQYYLQGRSYRHRNTREDLLAAVRYYEKALHEDSNYALAYAGLSDAYAFLGLYGYMAPIEGRRKAEEAARKALALDDHLAEAQAALGAVYVLFSPSDFSQGDQALRRAIELSPSLAVAHLYLGTSLERQGRLDEGSAENLKAREFDPLSSVIARTMARAYQLKGDYARALELLRQADEVGPSFTTTWEIGIYIQNKLFNETLAELEKAKAERQNDSILIYDTGMVYAAQGKRAEALEIIKELEEMSGVNLSQAHWIAKIYATLNEKELALSWLERGLAMGAITVFYKDEPVWNSIRSDPRFEAFVEKTFDLGKTPPAGSPEVGIIPQKSIALLRSKNSAGRATVMSAATSIDAAGVTIALPGKVNHG